MSERVSVHVYGDLVIRDVNLSPEIVNVCHPQLQTVLSSGEIALSQAFLKHGCNRVRGREEREG